MTFDSLPHIPKVSIVVLNWNGLADTLACLESLKDLDYRNYGILVVDNASTDGSVEELQKRYGKDPKVEIVRNQVNLGFAEGNNVGIGRAQARKRDYVLTAEQRYRGGQTRPDPDDTGCEQGSQDRPGRTQSLLSG